MTNLFGFNIYTKGKKALLSELKHKKDKIHIISGNAEVLKKPLKDKELFKLYTNESNIIIPDGISVYYPIKKRKNKHIEKITGIDLMQEILKECESEGKEVYFLGAKDEILSKMIKNLTLSYPKLKISGYHHGYIDINDCNNIIEDINKNNPYAIFVAMGTPTQEDFIFKYQDKLKCSIFMGVGGSFDVLSGEVNRCPEYLSKIGLEWLYRITKDPSKIKRLWNNLYFTITAFIKG